MRKSHINWRENQCKLIYIDATNIDQRSDEEFDFPIEFRLVNTNAEDINSNIHISLLDPDIWIDLESFKKEASKQTNWEEKLKLESNDIK